VTRVRRRLIAIGVVATALGMGGAAGALAAGGGASPGDTPTTTTPTTQNPCKGPLKSALRCPDIRMGTPGNMYAQRYEGHVYLRATNYVNSRGAGPIEVRGRRIGATTMKATQAIYRKGGRGPLLVYHGGRLDFKHARGHGNFWKFRDAARFELWSLDSNGKRNKLVKTGPKQHYCLRDLVRSAPSGDSPRNPHYPACNQNPKQGAVTLGTSVGWSDVYPSTYYEQWIDVKGLSGTFAYVQRADPRNHIWESNESNNAAQVIVHLPWRGPYSDVGR
jgi:lysyl oxidase